jgi:hypothetical protein
LKYVLNLYFLFRNRSYFHVKKEDIEAVVEKALHSSKKINYIPIVNLLTVGKAEVRVLCVWKKRFPTLLCNLVRLEGNDRVKFNKDRDWVGGTMGYLSDRH